MGSCQSSESGKDVEVGNSQTQEKSPVKVESGKTLVHKSFIELGRQASVRSKKIGKEVSSSILTFFFSIAEKIESSTEKHNNNVLTGTRSETSPISPKTYVASKSPKQSGAFASGAAADTPTDTRSLDSSYHGRDRINSASNMKTLGGSISAVGLDSMIEVRKQEGDLTSNVVQIEVPFGKPIEEVYDGVHNGPVLGSGISGLVRLVTHKATGVKYAVKCLDLGLVDSAEGLQQLREEIFIMCQLDHPNIVRLEEVYESHSEIYLVQELCLGGELFDRLDEQPDYHYTECECAKLVKQMLCAVRYLHSKGIIHRDLKLENFLFSSTSQDSELKMIGEFF